MRKVTRLVGVLVGAVVVLGLVVPRVSFAQALVGLRSEWGDLETWTHALTSSRESELGLGLQVTGSTGTTLLAFMGRRSLRSPTTPPDRIGVQVGTGKMTNPNLIRRATLSFLLDEGTDKATAVNLTSSLRVDNPTPGAIITDGVAEMSPDDFTRLAQAKTVKTDVLGFEGMLRPDQIAAIKMLAAQLHLAQ